MVYIFILLFLYVMLLYNKDFTVFPLLSYNFVDFILSKDYFSNNSK